MQPSNKTIHEALEQQISLEKRRSAVQKPAESIAALEHSAPIEVFGAEAIHEIGLLRYNVWKDDGLLDLDLFPNKTWVDEMDFGERARHWVVRDLKTGQLVSIYYTVEQLSLFNQPERYM